MRTQYSFFMLFVFCCCLYAAKAVEHLDNTNLEIKQDGRPFYSLLLNASGSKEIATLPQSTYACYHMYISDKQEKTVKFSLGMMRSIMANMMQLPKYLKKVSVVSNEQNVAIKGGRTNFITLNHNSIAHSSGKPPAQVAQIASNLSGNLSFIVYDDADGDGLKDIEEYDVYGAWPGLADTDCDGLSDGEEAKVTKTRPMLYDTDGDGIGDKDDPNPLVPYFVESYSEWTKHWKSVAASLASYDESWKVKNLNLLDNENLDFDGDGFSNIVEFQKRTSPIIVPGPPKIIFSEKELVRSTAEDTQKSFEMLVLSHNSVTGLLCISHANLPVTFELDKFQFMPGAKLPKPPSDAYSRMFLSRYGLPLKVNVDLPKASKGDVAREDIYVLCNTGRPSQTLPVVSVAGGAAGDNYMVPPELVAPASGSVVRNPYVTFSWDGDFKSYRLDVISPEWKAIVEKDMSGSEYSHDFSKLASGRYYWMVTGKNSKGYKASSAYGSFIYLNPEYDSKDSDEDGYSDNDEFLNGTNPDDANERPLNFKNCGSTLIKARCGQYFSQNLMSDGGVGRKFWYAKDELPEGVELKWNGILCGVPEKAQIVTLHVMACDEAGHTAERNYTLHVQDQITSKCVPGSGSIGKQK